MYNKTLSDLFIIHLEKTCKEEFEKQERNLNEKVTQKTRQINISYKKLDLTFERYNSLQTKYPVKPCSPNLRVHENKILEEIGIKEFEPNTIYFFADYSYLLRIENVAVFNNTDPPGPKVQKPISQDDSDFVPILDSFQFIGDNELLAARNNSFASEIHAKENKNLAFPVVAVIDTGIDLGAFRKSIDDNHIAPLHFYKNPCESDKESNCCCSFSFLGFKINCKCKNQKDNCGCLKSENYVIGRNFYDEGPYGVYPDHPFDNDGYTKHGTRLAKIIANITKNKVRIMSLKTANHSGEHNVFDIYSALEYILKYNKISKNEDKVRIVNASWSYCPKQVPLIMKYYINALKDEGVIFVTTAGNEKEEITNRYPAMLFEPDKKFIVVTSLEETNKNPVHGHSNHFVKNAVIGDENGEFIDILKNIEEKNLRGTSYAAAIYSGYFANGLLNQSNVLENQENSNDGFFNGKAIVATDLY